MNLLITGASGYIGKILCQRLQSAGNQISIVKRKYSNTSSISHLIHKEWIIDEVNDNFNNIFSEDTYDAVIHLATLFQADHKHEDINELVNSNYVFGLKIVDAMVKNGCLKLINFTSSWQNYSQEDSSPVNLYSAIKRSFSDAVKYYESAYSLNTLNLRIYDTYGPNDNRRKIIPILQKAFIEKTLIDLSPGEQLMDFVHIDDICKGVSVALDHIYSENFISSEFALASFNPRSLKDIAVTFSRLSNCEHLLKFGGRPYRNREVMSPYYPFPALPNWEPDISLELGLKSLINNNGN